MEKLVLSAITLVFVGVIGVACSREAKVPEFPYQHYLDALDAEGNPLVAISDNDYGYNPICPHIRYAELPEDLAGNALADSLLQFYNASLAYNAFMYDLGTSARYLNEDSTAVTFANAFEAINLSGVKNEKLRKALQSSAQIAAESLRQEVSPYERPNDGYTEFMKLFDEYTDGLFMPRYTDEKYDPYYVLWGDYYKLHDKALAADSLNFRGELVQMVLKEKDPVLQVLYACELAYSNYVSEEKNNEEVVAVFDMLLRADKYSPMLRDIWRIWRVILQMDLLGGPSNDSPMYNLFYNDMRNRVALTIIKHITAVPEEEDWFACMELVKLGFAENINRHSGIMVGSNVISEDMELFYNQTR